MKKLFLLLAVASLILPGFAKAELTNFPNGVSSFGIPVMGAGVQIPSTTGTYFFVDSGTGSNLNDGTDPTTPFSTIDYAIGRTTANNGDVIVVFPGHSETITSAGAITLDKAGIYIVGLGKGSLRPTVNYGTATTASIKVNAANCTINNVIADMTGVDAVARGIDVDAAGFHLLNTRVLLADSAGQAVTAVGLDANADYAKILNCEFVGSTDTGAASAIEFEGAADEPEIGNCKFMGDFSDAAIFSTLVVTNAYIHDCSITNYQNGDHAIEFSGNATGVIANCQLGTDAVATGIDPGYMTLHNVTWCADGDTVDNACVSVMAMSDEATNLIGYDDNNNSAATTNVASNADGSVLERLEYIQIFPATDSASNIVGVDDASNLGTTVNVTSDGDGSIVERLEYLQTFSEKTVKSSAIDVSAGTVANVFTIAGGPIEVIALVAEFTTAVSNNACTLTPTMDPTNGADTNMAASVNIQAAAQYSWYSIDGTIANAGVIAVPGTALPLGIGMDIPLVLPPGTIDLTLQNADPTTGAMTFYLRYRPLDNDVTVTAS